MEADVPGNYILMVVPGKAGELNIYLGKPDRSGIIVKPLCKWLLGTSIFEVMQPRVKKLNEWYCVSWPSKRQLLFIVVIRGTHSNANHYFQRRPDFCVSNLGFLSLIAWLVPSCIVEWDS